MWWSEILLSTRIRSRGGEISKIKFNLQEDDFVGMMLLDNEKNKK